MKKACTSKILCFASGSFLKKTGIISRNLFIWLYKPVIGPKDEKLNPKGANPVLCRRRTAPWLLKLFNNVKANR